MVENIEELVEHPIDPNRPLSFEDWCKEFRVGCKSKQIDSLTEIEIKKMKIKNYQMYCPMNSHYITQAIFLK